MKFSPLYISLMLLAVLITASAPRSEEQEAPAAQKKQDAVKPASEDAQNKKSESIESKAKELTLDQVLEGFYKAVGGKKNWEDVDTMLMRGARYAGSNRVQVKAYNMKPNKCRADFSLKENEIIQSFDGKTGWTQSTLSKDQAPRIMSDWKARYFDDTCYIGGPLINYKNIGAELAFQGKSDLYGKKVYKIEVTYKSGNRQVYYLDEETFLPVRMDGDYLFEAGEVTRITTTFSNYKVAGDFIMPHTLEFHTDGKDQTERITFNTILFNVKIDEKIFSLPK